MSACVPVSARHGAVAAAYLRAKRAEMSGRCPRATCPRCGRDCGVYWPTGGDGTVRITFWHKRPDGRWCRAEVDVADVCSGDGRAAVDALPGGTEEGRADGR